MTMLPTTLLFLALAAQKSDVPAEKPIKPLPTLSKEPKLDGVLKDFQGTDLKVSKEASNVIALKAGFRKDTLFLAITAKDDKVVMGDAIAVNLYFPTAGTTARGFRYLFGPDGRRNEPEGAPAWAQGLVKAGVKADAKGLTLELAFPARALPRMPAQLQLALNICVDFMDKDEEGDPVVTTSCSSGEMVAGPTRLPDELRKNLKLTAPAEVEGLEARPNGWVGYAVLHYPIWAVADSTLTPESLAELIAGDKAIDPKSVQLPLPSRMELNDNRPIFTVLTGINPYAGDQCHAENELRMALYVVKGSTAARVLEWPAATCSLGRAMGFDLNSDGGLTIGYTNGSTAHFSWSSDHFERSELGKK
jgi:hypothetical protein